MKTDRSPAIIVPGWGGSEPAHWQTSLEHELGATRIAVRDWYAPAPAPWVTALDAAIAACARPPVLIAHSLGCVVIAHWAARMRRNVRGALLVAPADIEAGALKLTPFAPLPSGPLPFHSIVVASDNDPYVSAERANAMAQRWNSSMWMLEQSGHINVASGHGPWPLAHSLLAQLQIATSRRAAR